MKRIGANRHASFERRGRSPWKARHRSSWWLLIGLAPLAAMILLPVLGWTLVALIDFAAAAILFLSLDENGSFAANGSRSNLRRGMIAESSPRPTI